MAQCRTVNPFEAQQNLKRRRSYLVNKNKALIQTKQRRNAALSHAKRSIHLLLDLQGERKSGSFVDQRIKQDTSMLNADSSVLRLRTLRARKSREKSRQAFNLGDTFTDSQKDAQKKGNTSSTTDVEDLVLTHHGKPISQLSDSLLRHRNRINDSTIDDDDEADTFLSAAPHFGKGTFYGEKEGDLCEKKSRKEIYEEIILKAKQAKVERLKEKEAQNDYLEKLDEKFAHIKTMLGFKSKTIFVRPDSIKEEDSLNQEELDYNNLLKKLSLNSRCQPTDRVKTYKELASERAAMFERLEQERVKAQETVGSDTETTDQDNTQDNETLAESEEFADDELPDSPSISSNASVQSHLTSYEKSTFSPAPEHNASVFKHHLTTSQLTSRNENIKNLVESYISSMDRRQDINNYKALLNDIEGVQSYTKNDSNDWERLLPFHVDIPSTYDDFQKLLDQYIPLAQLKLLCRMHALWDPCLSSTYHTKLQRLLDFLLKYLFDKLTLQFGKGIIPSLQQCFGNSKSCSLPENIHLDAIGSLFMLKGFIANLANAYPKNFMDFFTLWLIEIGIISCPALLNHIKKLPAFMAWKTHLDELRFWNAKVRLLPEALALLHLIFTFYPDTSSQNTLVTCALMILDVLGQYAAGMTQHEFQSVPDSRDLDDWKIETDNQDNAKEIHKRTTRVLSLAKDCSVSHSTILVGLAFQCVLCDSPRYIPCLFPLACAILGSTASQSDVVAQKITSLLCSNMISALDIFFQATKKAAMDFLLMHIILPTTFHLLECNPTLTSIASLHTVGLGYLQKPIFPIHLGKVEPEGIKMLIPKYVNAVTPSGARYLRFKGASEEMIKTKKLRRSVKNERRGASRQLRRDAEVLNTLRAHEKRKADTAKEKKYKETIATLERDAQELHRMRTSVIPQRKPRHRQKKKKS